MPTVSTLEQLANALAGSAFAADPIADLAARGYTLTDSLSAQLNTALSGKTLAGPPAGMTPEQFRGPLTFQSTPAPIVPAAPAADGYDVVAGLRMAAGNEALSALYKASIPHQVALDQYLTPTELVALGSEFVVNTPGGEISRLQIVGPPTVNSIVNGSSVVALQIPIEIDWVKTHMLGNGVQMRKTVTEAVGVLQLTASLVADVMLRDETSSSTMTIAVQLDTDASPAESPRLTLNGNSPVQRTSPIAPGQIDGLAVIIQNALAQELGGVLRWTISPHFSLLTGSLEVSKVDVVAVDDVLIAGLQVVGTGTAGNPAMLTNLLPNAQSNIFAQVREVVFNLFLEAYWAAIT